MELESHDTLPAEGAHPARAPSASASAPRPGSGAPALLLLKPVTTPPVLPPHSDEDVRALHAEFKAEDAHPDAMRAEIQSLLELPPAGLARRVRDLQNTQFRLQGEEVDILIELGLHTSSSPPGPAGS